MVIYRDFKIGGSANQLLLNLDQTLRQMFLQLYLQDLNKHVLRIILDKASTYEVVWKVWTL